VLRVTGVVTEIAKAAPGQKPYLVLKSTNAGVNVTLKCVLRDDAHISLNRAKKDKEITLIGKCTEKIVNQVQLVSCFEPDR
jgi:hypothetical protein